ncbi:hypothetical protein AB9P05_21545 [Roseivirga sp. BDSF3-8]|uniref:hypothetical protein n=1 Tax=Roseivirga sp. BDSF3-8 TaxID=3241598 RepID=UPI003531DD3B
MDPFYVISLPIMYGMTLLNLVLPYKCGYKATGYFVSSFFGVMIAATIPAEWMVVFIWPFLFLLQLIFNLYWGFRLFGRKKAGTVISFVLAGILLLLSFI